MLEMTHRGTAELNTERLLLRRFSLRDAQPAFENWLSEEKVTRFLTFELTKAFGKFARSYASGRAAMPAPTFTNGRSS